MVHAQGIILGWHGDVCLAVALRCLSALSREGFPTRQAVICETLTFSFCGQWSICSRLHCHVTFRATVLQAAVLKDVFNSED